MGISLTDATAVYRRSIPPHARSDATSHRLGSRIRFSPRRRCAFDGPPRPFIVDTPATVAVDLGCRYTLEVAEDGSEVLRVEAGWVGFEHERVRSLVPANAMAATRPGSGPGTPHDLDVAR